MQAFQGDCGQGKQELKYGSKKKKKKRNEILLEHLGKAALGIGDIYAKTWRVRIEPVKTLEKDSEGSLFQAEGRVGIKPHSGAAELGARPVVQQDRTGLSLAWGRHFCTAHQISSQPGLRPGVQYVSCETLFSLNHGVLPGRVLWLALTYRAHWRWCWGWSGHRAASGAPAETSLQQSHDPNAATYTCPGLTRTLGKGESPSGGQPMFQNHSTISNNMGFL